MKLQRMHDIGGIRAVVADMRAVDELYRSYIESSRKKGRKFIHELIRQYDYVSQPKDSGYRGRHLVFRYHNERPEMECYNGLTIEMQLRTKLQHIWATAVETFEISRTTTRLTAFTRARNAAAKANLPARSYWSRSIPSPN